MKTKKNTKRFMFGIITFMLICFVIYDSKNWGKSDDKLQLNQGFLSVVLKDEGTHMESIIVEDPYSVYNFLSSILLEKADYEIMERWDYKIILTNNLTFEENETFYIPENENNTVIYVYNACIEIDGILYESSDGVNILEWFHRFYENNVTKYKRYTLYG